MPEITKVHLFIGQVWKHKDSNQRLCIGGIRKEVQQVWTSGLIGNEILPVAHLIEYYEPEEGWKFD